MPALAYRPEIDGLRAIAVLAVVFFHFGWLPNGYLGVDVFFVISGYLITRILYQARLQGKLSLLEFYVRRSRRILPLVLFFCALCLVVGALVMLPDDLENLAQSVFATLGFGNNFLLLLTTGNYWDVINEYKPLMHTWSLGVEEQFYLLYPLLFLLFRPGQTRRFTMMLGVLAVVSLLLNFVPGYNDAERFYLLPFRFYELAAGGGIAMLFQGKRGPSFGPIFGTAGLLVLFLLPEIDRFDEAIRAGAVAFSALFIASSFEGRFIKRPLTNPLLVGLGRISFSVYLWHQVLLAFARYFLFAELTPLILAGILGLTLLFSVLTFRYIETPFRAFRPGKNRAFVLGILTVSSLVATLSLFVYFRAGVIHDVPELDIKFAEAYRGMHDDYLAAVDTTNTAFGLNDQLKVLVVGDSYASDWINVLRQSPLAKSIDVAHVGRLGRITPATELRADVIYYARKSTLSAPKLDPEQVRAACSATVMDKLRIIGTKNFGPSMGIYYNHRREGYCDQAADVPDDYAEENVRLKEVWGTRYVDVMAGLSNPSGEVRVFDENCRLLSNDGRHLTRAGAAFLAELATDEITLHLEK